MSFAPLNSKSLFFLFPAPDVVEIPVLDAVALFASLPEEVPPLELQPRPNFLRSLLGERFFEFEAGTGAMRFPWVSTAGDASAGELGADPLPLPVNPESFLTNFFGWKEGTEKPVEAFGVASASIGGAIGVGRLPGVGVAGELSCMFNSGRFMGALGA